MNPPISRTFERDGCGFKEILVAELYRLQRREILQLERFAVFKGLGTDLNGFEFGTV